MVCILWNIWQEYHETPISFQTDLLGLIVACVCHDLDHRGTNNHHQSKMSSPLATLYRTSTLEQHHLNICLLILTNSKIMDNLSKVWILSCNNRIIFLNETSIWILGWVRSNFGSDREEHLSYWLGTPFSNSSCIDDFGL